MDLSTCPLCYQEIPFLELERHANNHLDDEEVARDFELAQEIAIASSPLQQSLNEDLQCVTHLSEYLQLKRSPLVGHCGSSASEGRELHEKIVNLVNLQVKEIYYEVEEGLIALLAKCLESDSENSISILSGYVDHFESTDSKDLGWGCGWRNIQMVSSHLLKQRQEAGKVLYGGCGFVPDIASLQRWLEIAWEKGFDAHGSSHFDHKIYGKKSWIGTTECATLFRSFGLRARIVDFCHRKDQLELLGTSSRYNNNLKQVYGPMDRYLLKENSEVPSTSHEKSKSFSTSLEKMQGSHNLIDWVWNYFCTDSFSRSANQGVILSRKAPLYFQHAGHSRTIVGIQKRRQRNGLGLYNLLILDPSHNTKALEKSLKKSNGWQKLVKRGVHTLKKQQYQLCFIETGVACGEEMEKLKTLHSIHVES